MYTVKKQERQKRKKMTKHIMRKRLTRKCIKWQIRFFYWIFNPRVQDSVIHCLKWCGLTVLCVEYVLFSCLIRVIKFFNSVLSSNNLYSCKIFGCFQAAYSAFQYSTILLSNILPYMLLSSVDILQSCSPLFYNYPLQ